MNVCCRMSVTENTIVSLSHILVMCILGFGFASAKQSREIYCGACIALVDEMNWSINSVDKKSTLQVGSFRIDSNGNQNLREIPLARSELHLTELLDDVCNRMSDYGQSTGSNGNRNYIRTSLHDGSGLQLDGVQTSSSLHSQLKSACETLIEDHEETLIESFQETEDTLDTDLCVSVLDHRLAMEDAVAAVMLQRANNDETADTDTTAAGSDDDHGTSFTSPDTEMSKEDL